MVYHQNNKNEYQHTVLLRVHGGGPVVISLQQRLRYMTQIAKSIFHKIKSLQKMREWYQMSWKTIIFFQKENKLNCIILHMMQVVFIEISFSLYR